MLHNSPSILAFPRTLIRQDRAFSPPGLLHMYYMRLCSEKLLSDIRERELCLPSFPGILHRPSHPRLSHLPSSVLPLPLQGTLPESLCTWLLFLEPLAATRDAPAELEAIPSPPFSALLRLYLVRTSLFLLAPCPFKGKKECSGRSSRAPSIQLDDGVAREYFRQCFSVIERSLTRAVRSSVYPRISGARMNT